MAIINLAERQMKRIHAAALALICVALSACSVSRISPAYVSQGLLKENGLSHVPTTLSVVDHIRNTAPAQSGASGFGLLRHNPPGEQLICETCTYQFAAPPTELVRQFVSSALLREGALLSGDGSKRVEIQVLQFEFFESSQSRGVSLNWQGQVGLRAIVTAHGSAVADCSHLESDEFNPGSTVFRGDIEEWVSRTVSQGVEHVLSDPRILDALKSP